MEDGVIIHQFVRRIRKKQINNTSVFMSDNKSNVYTKEAIMKVIKKISWGDL